jgi:hypothetical protein
MSVARRIVEVAARSLPASARDRYREQWLADLQDAAEVGVRPGQIARGAVAVAVAIQRPSPLPWFGAELRGRVARAIGLSAALVGLSQYAGLVGGYGLGDHTVPSASAAGMGTSLMMYAVIASVVALLMAFSTRSLSARTRTAVVFFAAASAAPIVQSSLNAEGNASWQPGLYASAIAYAVGAVLVIAGIALTSRRHRDGAPRVRAALVAGIAVLLVGAAGLGNGIVVWSQRPPLAFGAGPRDASNPVYVQWLQLKEQFEALMAAIFAWSGVAIVVLAAAVVVFAIARRHTSREILGLGLGAVAVAVLAGGGLLGFLELAQSGIVPAGEAVVVLTVGRILLLGASLSGVVGRTGLEPVTEGL